MFISSMVMSSASVVCCGDQSERRSSSDMCNFARQCQRSGMLFGGGANFGSEANAGDERGGGEISQRSTRVV